VGEGSNLMLVKPTARNHIATLSALRGDSLSGCPLCSRPGGTSDARHRCKPCFHLLCILDLGGQVSRIDSVHLPAVGEGLAQLPLSHTPRAPVPGLALAEAQEEEMSPRAEHSANATFIATTVRVVKHVEYPRVGGGVEALAVLAEVEDVRDIEPDRDAAPPCFVTRLTDRLRRSIDADNLEPRHRKRDGVLATAAAEVDDSTSDLACLEQAHELRLSASDVPGRRSFEIGGLEPVSHVASIR
jgi:hypothetical protein